MSKKKVKSISSLLDELDKLLYEGRWREIDQLLKKTSKKLAIPEAFTCFIRGEEHLDNHLLGQKPADLQEADAKLREALRKCEPGHDAPLQQLAKVKYGQLLWLQGDRKRAVVTIREGVSTSADTSLMHTCRVLAEGNLYMALCLEEAAASQSKTVQLSQAVSAYEDVIRLSLNFLHQAKSSGVPYHPSGFRAIKTALERGPLISLQLRMPFRALGLYRRVLQAKDEDILQEVRQISATSLASLLLFHASPSSHPSPTVSSLSTHPSASSPSQLQEESILVAFLAKSFTDSWVVSMSNPVPSPATLFDLLTVVLSDVKLHGQLVQVLEDSMRFACDMPHIWLQFALALVSNGQIAQALAVFHECINLAPKDPLIIVTGANFALEKSRNPKLCIEWATKASEIAGKHFLEPRIQYLLGKGYAALCESEQSSQKRGELFKLSLAHLKQAVELDPQNVDFAFHHALQLAESRELVGAQAEVQRALSLNAGHTSCLHLLALIFSSQKQYVEALKVCEFALLKQPENFGLLECKIKLEAVASSSHRALQTCKYALQLWQTLFSEETSGLIGLVTQDQCSLSDMPLHPHERTDNPDPFASISPDVASDAGSSNFNLSTPNLPPNQPNLLQARIWCTIAEVFLSTGKISDATSCVREAQYLGPHLPRVFVTYGQVLEMEGKTEQALEQYRNALALQPINPTVLTLIGQLLHCSGKHVEAEKYLREAASIDQLNHQAWYWLGEVFAAQDEHERSADCFKTSLNLEQTAPIQPFSAVLSSFIPSS